MKFLISLSVFFCVFVFVHGHSIAAEELESWDVGLSAQEMAQSQWAAFKATYKRQYATEGEERYRMKVFLERATKIARHNQEYAKGTLSFKRGINKFSDMTHEEFHNTMIKCYRKTNKTDDVPRFIPPAHVTLPDEVDWRKDGAVTEVKDQGRCGACYSFSATGALEGQHFRKEEELVSLSEQNLVDCTAKYGNEGCDGGLADIAFLYVKKNKGIDTEKSYPYVGRKKRCRYKAENKGATCKGYKEIEPRDEEHLKAAIATIGPIAVSIDGSHESFQDYTDGVYFEPKCSSDSDDLGHAVLAVGYGTDPEAEHPNYWLIKNSWGDDWGEQGYIRVARNEDNHCGIATDALYPIV